MKRSLRLKHNADNVFTATTAIPLVKVLNGKNCLITDQKTINGGKSITTYAYMIYENHEGELNAGVKVFPVCGILNCINPDHLEAEYVPSRKDREYIDTYKNSDTHDELAKLLHVPVNLLREYLRSKKA